MILTAAPQGWTPDRIRALRKRLRWTQEEMADALGYEHARSISALENGERTPVGSARVLLELIDQHDGLPARKGEA